MIFGTYNPLCFPLILFFSAVAVLVKLVIIVFFLPMKLIRNGEIDAAISKLRDWYPQIVQVCTQFDVVYCFEHTIQIICHKRINVCFQWIWNDKACMFSFYLKLRCFVLLKHFLFLFSPLVLSFQVSSIFGFSLFFLFFIKSMVIGNLRSALHGIIWILMRRVSFVDI